MIIHFTTINEKRPIPPKYNDLQVEHGRHKKISIKLDRQCSQTAHYHKYKNLPIFRSSLQHVSINKETQQQDLGARSLPDPMIYPVLPNIL